MSITADKTYHQKIYSKTYWGSFKNKKESVTPEIIQNRNDFISQFSVIDLHSSRCFSKMKFDCVIPSDFSDHFEAYRTKTNGIVIIVSPYQEEGCMIPSAAILMGFIPYKKMYHPNASTFIATFGSMSIFRKTLRLATIRGGS